MSPISLVATYDVLSDEVLRTARGGVQNEHPFPDRPGRDGLTVPWWLPEAQVEPFLAASQFGRAGAIWAAMVERSMAAFAERGPDRVVVVRYEEFTRDPARLLATICGFLGEHESRPLRRVWQQGLAVLDRSPQGPQRRRTGRLRGAGRRDAAQVRLLVRLQSVGPSRRGVLQNIAATWARSDTDACPRVTLSAPSNGSSREGQSWTKPPAGQLRFLPAPGLRRVPHRRACPTVPTDPCGGARAPFAWHGRRSRAARAEHQVKSPPEGCIANPRHWRGRRRRPSIGRAAPVSLKNGSTMSSPRAPRVSIGLPVFNGETFVSYAIGSILAQTYTDFELIISDNASTDRTEAICHEFAASDRRIRYYRNDRNLGAAVNFNRTFELASGEYFKWAAHDDMLAPEYLERCVAALDAHPDAVLCQTLVQQIGASGEFLADFDTSAPGAGSPWPSERFGASILTFHHAIDIFGVIRADALARTPLHLPHAGSDKALLADLALASPFVYVREPLFIHRDHPGRFVHKVLKSRDEILVWYGAGCSARQVWSWWRHYGELFDLVARRVPDRRERLRCYGHLMRWLTIDRNFRGLVNDAFWAVDPRTVAALRALSQWWRGRPPVIDSTRRIWAQPNDVGRSSLRAGQLPAHGDEP